MLKKIKDICKDWRVRRTLESLLCITIASSSCAAPEPVETTKTVYTRNIEGQNPWFPHEGNELIYHLIKEAERNVKTPVGNREEAIEFFQDIYDVLTENNLVFKKQGTPSDQALVPKRLDPEIVAFFEEHDIKHIKDYNPRSFNCSREVQDFILYNQKVLDYINDHLYDYFYPVNCSKLTLNIYTIIADALGEQIGIAKSRNHLLVRYPLNKGDYVNWETTSGEVKDDSTFIRESNLTEESVEAGVYLRTLDEEGVKAVLLFDAGNDELGKGNLEEALKFFNLAISLDPSDPEFYINRGLVYQKQNDLREALLNYDMAARLDPNHPYPYNNAGLICLDVGNLGEAATLFEKAEELDQNEPLFPFNLGLTYALRYNKSGKDNDLYKALDYFDRAIALDQAMDKRVEDFIVVEFENDRETLTKIARWHGFNP